MNENTFRIGFSILTLGFVALMVLKKSTLNVELTDSADQGTQENLQETLKVQQIYNTMLSQINKAQAAALKSGKNPSNVGSSLARAGSIANLYLHTRNPNQIVAFNNTIETAYFYM